jgi:hypothetical protein
MVGWRLEAFSASANTIPVPACNYYYGADRLFPVGNLGAVLPLPVLLGCTCCLPCLFCSHLVTLWEVTFEGGWVGWRRTCMHWLGCTGGRCCYTGMPVLLFHLFSAGGWYLDEAGATWVFGCPTCLPVCSYATLPPARCTFVHVLGTLGFLLSATFLHLYHYMPTIYTITFSHTHTFTYTTRSLMPGCTTFCLPATAGAPFW